MPYYEPTEQEIAERQDGLREFDRWNVQALLAVWALWGVPGSYLDLGCGTGAMVAFARRCGVDAVGVDVIASPPDFRHDLRVPLELGRKFDLVTTIETAEHLPDESSDTFVGSIARHVKRGGFVVFTAALPGQPGNHHVNLQRPDHWRALFHHHGLTYWRERTLELALLWSYTTGPLMHLPGNMQVFHKG